MADNHRRLAELGLDPPTVGKKRPRAHTASSHRGTAPPRASPRERTPANTTEYGYQARWHGGPKWYSATVVSTNEDGTVNLKYRDGDFEENVNPKYLRKSI
jgi:hypothetical protein